MGLILLNQDRDIAGFNLAAAVSLSCRANSLVVAVSGAMRWVKKRAAVGKLSRGNSRLYK